MTRITGAEARDLLDIWEGDEDGLILARRGAYDNYGDMFEAAPDLAETIAWLYSRASDKGRREPWHEGHLTHGGSWSVHRLSDEVDVTLLEPSTLTPDEAVDLARALLAAAEEARQ